MRKKLCLLIMLSAISMAGCSSGGKGVVEVKDGAIYLDGSATTLIEHTGYTAKEPFALNPSLTVEYSIHEAFGDCGHNPQGVAIGNVTKSDRDKKISYFSSYGGSQYTMHRDMGGELYCGYIYSPETVQLDVVINQMTNSMQSLVLGDIKKAKMGNIEVHDWPDILITTTSITVPGSFSVLKGNVTTTETREFNKQSVGYLADSAYDYYQYGEYVVQALKGYDISQCITFLKE